MTALPIKLVEPPVRPVETYSSTVAEPARPLPVERAETACQPSSSEVSTSSTDDGRRFLGRGRVPGWLAEHPEWLALLLAAVAWVALALVLDWFAPDGTPMPGHHHAPEGTAAHSHSVDTQLLSWLLMVIAMMLPTAVPHLRYLGFNTRRTRRQRTLALFTLGYLAAWLAPGVLLAVIPGSVPASVVAVLVLAAGAWELTPIKRRALRGCCRTMPVGFAGPSADAAAVEYGLRHGVVCLLVSGPAMVVLMLAGHPWWATVALAVVMAAQKLLTRPERWRAMVTIGWLASGLAVAGLAILDAT